MIFVGLFAKLKIYLIVAAVAGVALLATFMAGRYYERADIANDTLASVVKTQRDISSRLIKDNEQHRTRVVALDTKLRKSEYRYEQLKQSSQAIRDWENTVMPPDSVRYYWVRDLRDPQRWSKGRGGGYTSILRWKNKSDRARGPALAEVKNPRFSSMCRRLQITVAKDNINKRQMLKFASDRLQNDQ